jgi:hypothetical protein
MPTFTALPSSNMTWVRRNVANTHGQVIFLFVGTSVNGHDHITTLRGTCTGETCVATVGDDETSVRYHRTIAMAVMGLKMVPGRLGLGLTLPYDLRRSPKIHVQYD